MTGFHSAWDDPNVKEALKERRAADIALLCCPACGNYSYYNEGSHFTCAWCEWSASGKKLNTLLDEVISLDDLAEMQVDGENVP